MNFDSNSERSKRSGDPAGIYVDIDSLLDTRLGTLAIMKEDYALEALKKNYFIREIDEFPNVPHEVFKKAYAKRDVETLMASTFTNVFTLINAFIKGNFEAAVTNANVSPVLITVNVHPYDLTEEEMVAISQAVSHRVKGMADVNVVNFHDAYLTPAYCRENFAIMIRYEYEPWIKVHVESKAFETQRMPGVSVVGPAIYQKIPTEEEMAELKEKNIHPFTAAETAMAFFFGLKLVDVETFCISKDVIELFKQAIATPPEKTSETNESIKPEEVAPFEPPAQVKPDQNDSFSEFDLL